MPVHHLALRSLDPSALAAYYQQALGLLELRRASDPDGLYSVWLDLGGAILMIERGARPGVDAGWDGMFLTAAPGSGQAWLERWAAAGVAVGGQTAFTLYARDPEGNRFGVSSFPEPLFRGVER